MECEPCSSPSATPRYSFVRRTDSQETSYQLYRNGRRLFAGGGRRDLLERFGSTISLDVAEASPLRTFVHAGIVAWGKAAVLIPGRSFSGKTTLVTELVRAGATYCSDGFSKGRMATCARRKPLGLASVAPRTSDQSFRLISPERVPKGD